MATQEINKGRRIGTIPVAGGEITVYTRGLECNAQSPFKSENEEWKEFKGFVPVNNWFSLFEVAMHLFYEEYKNPVALSKYFSIDESVSDVMSELYNPDIRDEKISILKEKLGDETDIAVKAYDRFRRFKEARDNLSVEVYNPVSADKYKAYILFTDMENKRRSRLGLNDINLNSFMKFIQKNLVGIFPIAEGTGRSIYIVREKTGNNEVYRMGNSEGVSYNLSVADRINLAYCLKHYFDSYEVRPISTQKFRLVNSEKTGKPLLGVGNVLLPINKDIYKFFGLISDCRY